MTDYAGGDGARPPRGRSSPPAEVTGPRRDHAFTFARRHGDQVALVVVPRLITRLAPDGKLPLGREVWQDTALSVPGLAGGRFRNVFTGETVGVGNCDANGTLALNDALARFPVALLLPA